MSAQLVVLDRFNGVVSRIGDGPQVFLKACPRCSLLVEHIRLTPDYRAHGVPLNRPYRYITAQSHAERRIAARRVERQRELVA